MTSFPSHQRSRQRKFFCLLALLATFATAAAAKAVEATPPPGGPVVFQQGPVLSTPARKSIPVSVAIADAGEILEVRLYFKTMASADYFFLPMAGSSKGIFTASLPPAKNDTKGIDYLLLFKNSRGEARKTRPFRLLVLNDYNAPPHAPDKFEALTEGPIADEVNHNFAVPLQLVTTPEPLLAYAVEEPNPQQLLPASQSGYDKDTFGGLSSLGGISFSIQIGGVGLFYRGFSSH
ncbi:MAG: hypothetical protein V2B20_21575 [Pseudomonadota bacterium]